MYLFETAQVVIVIVEKDICDAVAASLSHHLNGVAILMSLSCRRCGMERCGHFMLQALKTYAESTCTE